MGICCIPRSLGWRQGSRVEVSLIRMIYVGLFFVLKDRNSKVVTNLCRRGNDSVHLQPGILDYSVDSVKIPRKSAPLLDGSPASEYFLVSIKFCLVNPFSRDAIFSVSIEDNELDSDSK